MNIPTQDAVLHFLRRPTAERGAIVARMGYPERCAWELAWARYAPGARGSVTQAREVFDGWVLVSCDALMEREYGA